MTTTSAPTAADLLTPAQRSGLAAVFADAIAERRPSGGCSDCGKAGVPCVDHEDDATQVGDYYDLAAELGIELEDS